MNIPSLIKYLYKKKEIVFTGLYSFEFVDENRKTISEIFFMIPPKGKTIEEPTRSSTVPTLEGNYNLDAGNGTKTFNLSGELYFSYVGSPDNPVSRTGEGLENTLDGMEEFLKLRWMLIRYRDYTMKKNGKITDPGSHIRGLSPQLNSLYEKISKNLNKNIGALYDKIEIIFHDYDMDDHWYCRVVNFSSTQDGTTNQKISYNISLEGYEPNSKSIQTVKNKSKTNELANSISQLFLDLNYNNIYETIQAQIGYNIELASALLSIGNSINLILDENDNIQSGKSTALTNLPIYVSNLDSTVSFAQNSLIIFFIPEAEIINYIAGTVTIDDYFDLEVLSFYNILQKIKIYCQNFYGIFNTIIKQEDLRFSENANNYLLLEEQFNNENSYKVENDTSFYFYTVQDGDTARSIAMKELQDNEKFIKILQINNISDNDFITGNLIGKQIKIPILSKTISNSNINLIFENDPNNISNFYHGKDFYLDINNNIVLSPTGDISLLCGIENTIAAIEKRLTSKKGSLNVFNPNWGVIQIGEGNAPLLVRIERYLNNVMEQVQGEPRVESATFDFNELIFSGESISIPIKITFLGSDDIKEVTANG